MTMNNKLPLADAQHLNLLFFKEVDTAPDALKSPRIFEGLVADD